MEKDCPREVLINTRNAYLEELDTIRNGQPQSGSSLELTVSHSCEHSDCPACGGISVDLSNGYMYCGLDVPAEVVAGNEMILNADGFEYDNPPEQP